MKHRQGAKSLSRRSPARRALLRTMTSQLLRHGALVTTRVKAKALLSFAEPLITKSKRELTLHQRRALLQQLNSQEDLVALLAAGRAAGERSSGFIRANRLPRRQGDAAQLVRIELIDR
ncbi:MAG: 50S ribosomal protein L17 [Candidatus Andersenbacteria bacterium]|nr:50S ribosomal protein L17 [Candidatus Andersenbacteria bacterium]